MTRMMSLGNARPSFINLGDFPLMTEALEGINMKRKVPGEPNDTLEDIKLNSSVFMGSVDPIDFDSNPISVIRYPDLNEIMESQHIDYTKRTYNRTDKTGTEEAALHIIRQP